MRFRFELATKEDDAALRHLAGVTPVPGQMTVAYEREPDYFRGCLAHGPFCQVIVAREESRGEIAGMAIRAVRNYWRDGEEVPVGYLGQLRVSPHHRGKWLVPAGFRFLRELVRDGRAASHFTTLIDGNAEAEALLVEKPRGSIPRYRPATGILSFVLPVPRRASRTASHVIRLDGESTGEALEFWKRQSHATRMFPVVDPADFESSGFPDLEQRDVYLCTRGSRIEATLGVWDTSRFKQPVVRSYSRGLAFTRPIVNLAASIRGWPRLPAVGEGMRFGFGVLLSAESGAQKGFADLVRAALSRAQERSLDFLVIGVEERDEVAASLGRFPHFLYRSHMFTVSWDGQDPLSEDLLGRRVHIEPGTL